MIHDALDVSADFQKALLYAFTVHAGLRYLISFTTSIAAPEKHNIPLERMILGR